MGGVARCGIPRDPIQVVSDYGMTDLTILSSEVSLW